jgi:hypothetical protein
LACSPRPPAPADLRGSADPPGPAGQSALAGAAGREVAENELGRLLAEIDRTGLPGRLVVELDDAEQLLTVARSVHNDAVRDTLGLRSRRLVRWFGLAGTAPLPAYFEIADAGPGLRPGGSRTSGMPPNR